VKCIATDVDDDLIRLLRFSHPGWVAGRCDFLSARSVACSPIASGRGPQVHAVVLNPPFSCRGARTISSEAFGIRICSSLAMGFLLRSAQRVDAHGQIAALIPAGSLTSQKDECAWQLLRAHGTVQVVEEFGRREFSRAFARTVLITVRRANGGTPGSRFQKWSTGAGKTRLVLHRGRLPMHHVKAGVEGWPVIHTTDLRPDGRVRPSYRDGEARLALPGPLLIVPRVGLPLAYKIALYRSRRRAILSDCLFAIAGPVKLLEQLQDRILANWDSFKTCYGGSCAPYTTVRRLLDALTALGAEVSVEPRLMSS
jgi:hypothetical protein